MSGSPLQSHIPLSSLSFAEPPIVHHTPTHPASDPHSSRSLPNPEEHHDPSASSKQTDALLDDYTDVNLALSPGLGPSMQRQTRSTRAAHERDSEPVKEENGNGNMNYGMEHRRKVSGLDGGSSFQTSQLMSMRGFSLDDDPPTPRTPNMPSSGTGFWDLPYQDRSNFLVLVVLYFLQGIPMGLATGSIPFLLKSHLSYGQIGVFTLASYPYSLKLLWSPIVDAVWSPRVGRRKSWILPVQAFSGIGMLYLATRVNDMMVQAGANGGAGIWNFTVWWFMLVFTCATQDIAVDGRSYW